MRTLSARTCLADAVRLLAENDRDVVPVTDRGRTVGTLRRWVAEQGVRHGLGRLPVRDVLDDLERFPGAPGRGRGTNVGDLLRGELSGRAVELLREVGRLAREAGAEAWLVGGVVRDLLLHRQSQDLDVAIEGPAQQVAERLSVKLGGRMVVHRAFRTATVVAGDGQRLDLAAARSERYRRPAALPEVSPGTLEQDLYRRDFTINAMAVRLTPRRFGELRDEFGGRRDLRTRRIRVLHGLSFIEDPTRALRAVRFASRLGFRLSRRTRRLIGVALAQKVFDELSSARLRREIERLMGGRHLRESVRLMDRLGLLSVLHPKLRLLQRTDARLQLAEQALRRHGTGPGVLRWVVGLGVLLAELDPAGRDAVLRRLRPSRKALASLGEAPERVPALLSRVGGRTMPRPSTIHAACRCERLEILLLAWAMAPGARERAALARYLEDLSAVRLEISGRELIRAGVPEGPAIAAGLDAALRARLDGRAPTAHEQLAEALRAGRSA